MLVLLTFYLLIYLNFYDKIHLFIFIDWFGYKNLGDYSIDNFIVYVTNINFIATHIYLSCSELGELFFNKSNENIFYYNIRYKLKWLDFWNEYGDKRNKSFLMCEILIPIFEYFKSTLITYNKCLLFFYKLLANIFWYFVDSLKWFLYISNITTTIPFKVNRIFYNTGVETPMFFYFGLLFLLSILFSYFFLSYLGLYGVFFLILIPLIFFWLSLIPYFIDIFVLQKTYYVNLGKWIYINSNYKLDFYFLFDTVSFAFVLLTTTIALFVFFYAFSYFRYEPLVDRFLLFLASFVISMIFLVSSGNTIMMFLGWELIGLTSFFLINFWIGKKGTLKAAFKAYSFNKISDFWLLVFLVTSFFIYYDFDIININNQAHFYYNLNLKIFNFDLNYIEFLCFTILGSAFIKSAQMGAHVWLPDSMEAPVPASSLIHSATLVSAGVYLVLRFNHLFEYSIYAKYMLAIIGSMTAAFGGIIAAFQSDIKRILAYSTISHCGFLMVLCYTQINEFVILYLYVHGFFKAGIFMCVGNVIRVARNYQDFRRMGMLWKYLPFEVFCIFIGLLNLGGLPFTLGFAIKHLIFVGFQNNIYLTYLILFFILLGAFSGIFYSYRLFYYVFFDFKKGKKIIYNSINKVNMNSIFYSNTSLASNTSIFLLFFVAYWVSYLLFFVFVGKDSFLSDCFNLNQLVNFYSNYDNYFGYLFNFSFLNWFVLFFIISLVFSHFRYTFEYFNIIYSYFYLIITVIFFEFLMNII